MPTNPAQRSDPVDQVRGPDQRDAEELAGLSAEVTADSPSAKTLAPPAPDSGPRDSEKSKRGAP